MAVRAVERRVSELDQPQRPILMLKMRCHDNELTLRGEDKAIAMKIVKRAPPGLIPSRRWFLGTSVAEREHHNYCCEEDTAATSRASKNNGNCGEVHSLGIS